MRQCISSAPRASSMEKRKANNARAAMSRAAIEHQRRLKSAMNEWRGGSKRKVWHEWLLLFALHRRMLGAINSLLFRKMRLGYNTWRRTAAELTGWEKQVSGAITAIFRMWRVVRFSVNAWKAIGTRDGEASRTCGTWSRALDAWAFRSWLEEAPERLEESRKRRRPIQPAIPRDPSGALRVLQGVGGDVGADGGRSSGLRRTCCRMRTSSARRGRRGWLRRRECRTEIEARRVRSLHSSRRGRRGRSRRRVRRWSRRHALCFGQLGSWPAKLYRYWRRTPSSHREGLHQARSLMASSMLSSIKLARGDGSRRQSRQRSSRVKVREGEANGRCRERAVVGVWRAARFPRLFRCARH